MNDYSFHNIQIGQTESFEKEMTLEMENSFRKITGDINPLHQDDNFAIETGNSKFKSHISFGMLTASLYSTLAGVYLPGKYSLIHSFDHLNFQNPVFVGDLLTVTGIVKEKQEELKLLVVKAKIKNQNHKIVSTASMKILVQK